METFEDRIAELRLRLMKSISPIQNPKEWTFFLAFIDAYFAQQKIKDPVIVELGTRGDRQKPYYQELFGATHIGIDGSAGFQPDIIGDTHDPETKERLKAVLAGRPINLLFIDADHAYEAVKKDYEMYEPMTENIVALHDIFNRQEQVGRFWAELQEQYPEYMKLTMYNWLPEPHVFAFMQFGIGLVIKRW